MSESNDFTNLVITEDKLLFSDDDVSVSIWHYVKAEDNKVDAESINLGAKISKQFLDFLAAKKEEASNSEEENSSYVTYEKLDDAIRNYLKERHNVTDPVLIVIQYPGHEPYLLVEKNRLMLPSPSSPTGPGPTNSDPCPAGKVRVADGAGGSQCLPKG